MSRMPFKQWGYPRVAGYQGYPTIKSVMLK